MYAAASGKVVFAEFQRLYGHTVCIYHGLTDVIGQPKHLYTSYNHMGPKNSENGYGYIEVRKGDRIESCGQIGRQGTSGQSTGIHLDWEILIYDKSPEEIEDEAWPSIRYQMIAASPNLFTDLPLTYGDIDSLEDKDIRRDSACPQAVVAQNKQHWDFNTNGDTEGWTAHHVESFKVHDGNFSGDILGWAKRFG